jgi:copper chaperone CopZ
MAPVILSMDVHCHGCAKKIQKAVMKLPGSYALHTPIDQAPSSSVHLRII